MAKSKSRPAGKAWLMVVSGQARRRLWRSEVAKSGWLLLLLLPHAVTLSVVGVAEVATGSCSPWLCVGASVWEAEKCFVVRYSRLD